MRNITARDQHSDKRSYLFIHSKNKEMTNERNSGVSREYYGGSTYNGEVAKNHNDEVDSNNDSYKILNNRPRPPSEGRTNRT